MDKSREMQIVGIIAKMDFRSPEKTVDSLNKMKAFFGDNYPTFNRMIDESIALIEAGKQCSPEVVMRLGQILGMAEGIAMGEARNA